jgi:predicted dinucleotide-binding enzyme
MGSVGATLGRRWAELGHNVTFGSREPTAPKAKEQLAAIKGQAAIASVPEAVASAEVVVLATPWSAATDAIRSAGDLAGKIVIDVTNPLKPDLSGLAIPDGTSGAQEIAKASQGARVYKAMNQTGYENMADPNYGASVKPVMFVTGDDTAGKATVISLVQELGFEAVDAGGIEHSRLLEDLAMLWIHLMVKQKIGRDFAFALLRRD